MTSCTICPRTLRPDEDADGLYACRRCIAATTDLLRELPLQMPLLAACRMPDAVPRAGRVGGTGRAHAPLPGRADVLTLLGPGTHVPLTDPHGDDTAGVPVAAVLVGWARHIAQDAGWHRHHHPADGHEILERWADPRPRHGHTVAGWSTWLQAYLPHAATRPYIRQLRDELEALLGRIRRITQTAEWRRTMAAPCPDCLAFGLVERWGAEDIVCEACGHRLTAGEYQAHAYAALPPLYRTALRMVAAASQQQAGPDVAWAARDTG